jgi:GT2 family glycosyltransferase
VSWLLADSVIAPEPSDGDHVTDWVSGASMMVRREVLDQVGLLDERFFLYFEEEELTLRAQRAGWKCHYVADSRVVHLVGQATGATGDRRLEKRAPAYWFESRSYYWTKSHGPWVKRAADLVFLYGHTLWQIRRVLQRKQRVDPPFFMWDFLRHNLWPHRKD